MLSHHIRIGYNPVRDLTSEEMDDLLLDEARRICSRPRAIEEEARRLGADEVCQDGCCRLEGSAENYDADWGAVGHPLEVVVAEGRRGVAQFAATDLTGFKYPVRRAFVRLLVEAMHRHGVEVSVTAA